jgi:hypothetical protein
MREALLALLLLAAPAAARADAYEEALAGARHQAEGGHFAEAARALAEPAAAWPQDFPLQLARAYYLLRAGAYPEAEAQYRLALGLEPDSSVARQGLAEARLGRGAPDQWWATLSGSGTAYGGQSKRANMYALALRLEGLVADRWSLGALYRGLGTTASVTGGGRGKGSGAAPSIQSEAHAWAGYGAPTWQLTLHGAGITRAAATKAGVEQVYGYGGAAAGLSAMARWGLEWRGSAVTTWYEDLTTTQLEGTGTLALLDERLALRAGGRTQLAEGGYTSSALAALEWRGPWSLALAGELGPQRRPVDLEARVLYDLPDELEWAVRLQTGLMLGHHVRAWLAADVEGWRTPPAAAAPSDYTATRLTAGLTCSY